MSTLFYIATGFTIFSTLAVLACVLFSTTARIASERVLAVSRGQRHSKPKRQLSREVQGQLFASIHWLRSSIGLSDDPKLLTRFAQSGHNSDAYRDIYAFARIAGPILGLVCGFFIASNRFFAMIAFAGVAYLAPDMILTRIIRRRREKIRLGIPDAIDLLVICVDAGLGMDQAMLRVGQELGTSHPEIYEEFLQISREQRAGKLRIEAWRAMAERSRLPEMDAFVNMLMQTERFGTPIARALSNFGDTIRQKRRQLAEEMAAKTTVKIIFPLVLCIFPSMFIVLLGPAGIAISRGLTGMGQ